MIISISGLIGSGKTSLAKNICKRFNLRYVSAGEIMRDMAKKEGMSLIEFSAYAEKHPEIDKKIDERQRELAKGDCVVDGRLSAYFTNPDISIWLTAPLDIREKRIAKRDKISLEDAKKTIMEREESERRRYKKFYNIDLYNIEKYDLVINTGKFNIEALTEILSSVIWSL